MNSIRTRFVVAVVATIALMLALFAGFSILSIHGTLRTSLDLQVRTAAQAINAAIDVQNGSPHPDAGDRAQIAQLRGTTHESIVDNHGRLVDGDPPLVHTFSGGSQLFSVQRNGDSYRVAVEPIVRKRKTLGYVAAWRSDDYIEEVVRDAILISLAAGAALLLLAALIALRVAETVVAPLNTIAATVERIEHRDLSLRVKHHGADELGRLAAAFDRMLDRLQAAFSRERTFTADASHELRAPLAVVRAEVELALRRERTPEEYRTALEGIMRETERLELLVDDLLAAARAEVDANKRKETDVGEVAQSVVERSAPAARAKEIDLRAHVNGSGLARIDPLGFERSLLAVVHNAIAFAPQRGHVDIEVERDGAHICVTVRDDGPGFSRDALEHAAERFWRGDGSRPRGGTGLGLAIARAIVGANDGTLTWGNAQGGGAQVTIRLAASRS